MCVAIYRPGSFNVAKVTEDQWNTIANLHDDGYGVAWRERGKLHAHRTIDRKSGPGDIWDVIDWLQGHALPFVAHVRTGTSGAHTVDYTHPFLLWDETVALVHNGILDRAWTEKKLHPWEKAQGLSPDDSDTVRFAGWLQTAGPDWPHTRDGRTTIAEQLQLGNRLALLYARDRVALWGGHWNDGIWWSNHDYTLADFPGYGSYGDWWKGADYGTAPGKALSTKIVGTGVMKQWDEEDDEHNDVPPLDYCEPALRARMAVWADLDDDDGEDVKPTSVAPNRKPYGGKY